MSRECRGPKWCAKKTRTAEDCQHTTRSRERGMEQILPHGSQRGQPCQCLDFGLPASKTETIRCPIYGTLLWQPEGTNPHLHQSKWTWFSVSLRSGTVPYLTLDPQASYSIWQGKVTLQKSTRASLVVQWLRICFPMKGRRFKPWSGK